MGLRFDPFRTSFSDDNDPTLPFEEIYVDPPLEPGEGHADDESLLARLQQGVHTFVFADYGMGKTATWRALEYTLRSAPTGQPALVVRYTPRLPAAAATMPAQQPAPLAELTQELIVDLLIQALERLHDRFPRASPPDATRRELLGRLFRGAPALLRQAIRRLANGEPGTTTNWGGLRPNILLREVAPAWRAWLKELISPLLRLPAVGWSWQEACAAAHALGFPTIFLLVDAVDERSMQIQRQMAVLEPILEQLEGFAAQQMFVKGFLPLELESTFQSKLQARLQGLTAPVELATIARRTPEHLHQIIDQRLSAASAGSASFKSLDWFRGDDISESIQERLVALAYGSPRELINLVSLLLDEHSSRGFQIRKQIRLNAADWEHILAKAVARRPRVPPAEP